jgi:hypothetical protein
MEELRELRERIAATKRSLAVARRRLARAEKKGPRPAQRI